MKGNLWRFAGLFVLTAALILSAALSSPAKHKSKSQPAAPGSAEEGKTVFNKNCKMCHEAEDTKQKIGPGLKDLFKNPLLPASHKPPTEEAVREQIEKGDPHAKPMPMPAFADKLSKEEIQGLMAYLKTL